MSVKPITAGRLRELLHYDPEAGVFRWLRSGSGRCLGGIAGCLNMDSADNRWCNLRAATHSKNGANKRKQQNNTSGFPGVSRFGVKWRARSKVNGKEVSLGLFDTRHQAYAAKCLDSRRNFGEYTRCYDDDIMIEPGPQSLGNDWLGI